MKLENCFQCGEPLSFGNYKMIAFDKPYLNIFICTNCYKILDEKEFIKNVILWYNNKENGGKNGQRTSKNRRK